jgi:tRNA-dihydrouridine synthase 3
MEEVPSYIVHIKSEFLAPKKPKEINENESKDNKVDEQNNNKKRNRDALKKTEIRYCHAFIGTGSCDNGLNCRFSHDLISLMKAKPENLGSVCYKYDKYGFCNEGVTCRFGSMHIDNTTGINLSRPVEQGGVIQRPIDFNILNKDLQHLLWKKKYDYNDKKIYNNSHLNSTTIPYPDKPVKLVDFSNKVYIAPLTTIGNLPFRRVLKDYGADITCGEMAMSNNLIEGKQTEWALLRRHQSEDTFGIQIAGANTDSMTNVSKLLNKETVSDFVDLNCGCPIDVITDKGCGSKLMTRPNRLCDVASSLLHNFNRSVTVKIRIGWDEPTAHKLVPMLQKINNGKLAAIMIHGRTRQQRYSKEANWDYIYEVCKSQDPTLPRVPIIGNGDILSYDDWKNHQNLVKNSFDDEEERGLCSCAMIGRGAIIKPWLCRELKEQNVYDISASERLDILKKFCDYGMEHWGSDNQGIATTRRFLLEWLGYLHRYVPVALVERTQKMQQRPPSFFGRGDLETLMASSDVKDWIKISEILLGPAPEDLVFEGKIKSNAYSNESEMAMSNG